MEKELFYIELFDIYKELLTEKQRELFESHYIFDLSLAEIAEPEGRTRQSVYDAIKKVKAKLTEYEESLKIHKMQTELYGLAESVFKKDTQTAHKILEIIGK